MTARRMPWRWRVADALNRLPWTCWAELVGWVQAKDARDRREYHSLRDSFARKPCRDADYDRNGTCYCGKFQDEATIAARQAAVDAEYPLQPDDPWADQSA